MKKKYLITLVILLVFNLSSRSQSSAFTSDTTEANNSIIINDSVEIRDVNGRKWEFMYKSPDGNTLTVYQKNELYEKYKSLGHSFKRENNRYIVILYTPEDGPKYQELIKGIRSDSARKVDQFQSLWLNKPMPDFDLTDIDGNRLSLSSLKGSVIVLNFWFTSCGPCIREMPGLNDIVAGYKDEKVVFVAIALDSKEKISEFLKKRLYNYRHVSSKEFTGKMGVEAFPAHIVIDKKGIIRFLQLGGDEIKERLKLQIDRALK